VVAECDASSQGAVVKVDLDFFFSWEASPVKAPQREFRSFCWALRAWSVLKKELKAFHLNFSASRKTLVLTIHCSLTPGFVRRGSGFFRAITRARSTLLGWSKKGDPSNQFGRKEPTCMNPVTLPSTPSRAKGNPRL
jgi:hypothetical protein